MPRSGKIYTRTGDDGTTSLGTKDRIPKSSLRVTAYGDVDELNSILGVILANNPVSILRDALLEIQSELFTLGADLSFPESEKRSYKVPRIKEQHIVRLERLIDRLQMDLAPLKKFILPGGTVAAANLHLARTVCRRAERTIVELASAESICAWVIGYVNRLSDALFVMARYDNHIKGANESIWDSE